MKIPVRQRGGERNTYHRRKVQQLISTDISELCVLGFLTQLKNALPDGVSLTFGDSTVAVFTHKSQQTNAYLIDFYPLDVDLTKEEAEDFIKYISLDEIQSPPKILSELLNEHIDSIIKEVGRVKKYHPDSTLTIAFAPADSISLAGTVALPVYTFLVSVDGQTRLETESSFVVLPDDETSRAYMADQ